MNLSYIDRETLVGLEKHYPAAYSYLLTCILKNELKALKREMQVLREIRERDGAIFDRNRQSKRLDWVERRVEELRKLFSEAE